MKTFLTLFILLFSSLVIAENISDFYLNNAHSYKYKIEGVSLGDNLLGHYNKVEINNAYSYKYKNDKFIYYVFELPVNSNYDFLQITIKINNNLKNNYPIHSISGIITCRNDIEKCFIKQNEIRKDLDLFFKQRPIITNGNHDQDKNLMSTWENLGYFLSDSKYSDIDIIVYDNSKEFEDQGQWDHLQLIMSSQEFSKFINEEAWK